MTGTFASTSRLTPSCRCSSVNRGQSPIDPQYTTAVIPADINCSPFLTIAAKSGSPSDVHGVMRAGTQPRKTFVFMIRIVFPEDQVSCQSIPVPNSRLAQLRCCSFEAVASSRRLLGPQPSLTRARYLSHFVTGRTFRVRQIATWRNNVSCCEYDVRNCDLRGLAESNESPCPTWVRSRARSA